VSFWLLFGEMQMRVVEPTDISKCSSKFRLVESVDGKLVRVRDGKFSEEQTVDAVDRGSNFSKTVMSVVCVVNVIGCSNSMLLE
jgi:hypothetical protein